MNEPAIINNRKLGALTGAVVGDLLGVTYEFMIPAKIPAGPYAVVGGGPFRFAPGRGSDDTDLTLCAYRSYNGDRFDPSAMRGELVSWWMGGPADVGSQTNKAIAGLAKGYHIPNDYDAQGNGGLMRASAHGVMAPDALDAFNAAFADTSITHPSRVTGYCSGFYAAVLYRVIHGNYDGTELDKYPYELYTTPQAKRGGHCIHSAALAFWALEAARAGGTYDEIIAQVIATGGDTDTNACIAGALIGAYLGEEAIPARYREAINTPGYNTAREVLMKGE